MQIIESFAKIITLVVVLILGITRSEAQSFSPVDEDSVRLRHALSEGHRYINTNLDSSFKYALETFNLSSRVSNPIMKSYAINLQGDFLLKLGNHEKALELFNDGLSLRMHIVPNDSAAIAYLHNQIANVYWQMNDTTQALQHYHNALRWTPPYAYHHPLHEIICNLLSRVGRVCLARHQLDSAKWYGAKADQVGDHVSAITSLFWGDINLYESEYTNAIQNFRKAATLGLHHDRNLEITLEAYDRLAHVYRITNQPDSAIGYSRKAFRAAQVLNNQVAVHHSGVVLAKLFNEVHQTDSTIYYQQKVIESAEAQLNQEKERQTLNTYFDEKFKEQEKAAEEKRIQMQLGIGGLLGGIVLVLVIVVRGRVKLKSGYVRKLKEVEMRALRAQMNPHFIFNCLGSINRYIVKSDTKTASNYLTKFAKLIRSILDNSASDHISLASEMKTLELYLEMESLRFDNGFDFAIEKDDELDADHIQLPSMLIQPYVENAIWHGLLQKEEKGNLWIRFKRIDHHTLQVEIEDNGIGRKKASELKSKNLVKQKSYGMQISSDRIQIINSIYNLNNSITIHDLEDDQGRATGTKIVLKIPVS